MDFFHYNVFLQSLLNSNHAMNFWTIVSFAISSIFLKFDFEKNKQFLIQILYLLLGEADIEKESLTYMTKQAGNGPSRRHI